MCGSKVWSLHARVDAYKVEAYLDCLQILNDFNFECPKIRRRYGCTVG